MRHAWVLLAIAGTLVLAGCVTDESRVAGPDDNGSANGTPAANATGEPSAGDEAPSGDGSTSGDGASSGDGAGDGPAPRPPRGDDPPRDSDGETPPPDDGDAGVWPVVGSFVRYETTGGSGSGDGQWSHRHEAEVVLRFDGERWTGTCTVETRKEREGTGDEPARVYENSTETRVVAFAPPRGPADPAMGETVEVGMIDICDEGTITDIDVERREPFRPEGQVGSADAWLATYQPEGVRAGFSAWWDAKTGLVLDWGSQRTYSYEYGHIEETDAPIAGR